MSIKNNLLLVAIAGASAVALSACGGGGDGSSSSAATPSSPTGPATSPTPQEIVPNDPYTGKTATGTLTTDISGMVVSGPTSGAIVTAYLLNPDGSNGAQIGQATTDAGGNYTMTLTQKPTGMIRLLATGGSYVSEADNSTQQNSALELVAPYVTTSLNRFVITPLTYVASQRISYMASKQGSTLANAYTTASSAVLELVTGKDVIAAADRTHGGVDYLSIVPGSAQDTLNAYADGLTAIEYYGVDFDLPSHVVVRLLAQSSLTNSASYTGADGQPINVGTWTGGTFDEAQVRLLSALGPGSAGGTYPYDNMNSIVRLMYAVPACTSGDHSAYYQRFPLVGSTDILDVPACALVANSWSNIKAKVATNKRSSQPA